MSSLTCHISKQYSLPWSSLLCIFPEEAGTRKGGSGCTDLALFPAFRILQRNPGQTGKVIHESGNGFQMLLTWFPTSEGGVAGMDRGERGGREDVVEEGRDSVFSNPSQLQSKVWGDQRPEAVYSSILVFPLRLSPFFPPAKKEKNNGARFKDGRMTWYGITVVVPLCFFILGARFLVCVPV